MSSSGRQILASEIAAGGSANRVVGTSDGSATAMQTVATGMIASDAVSAVSKAAPTTNGPTTTSSTYATMAQMEVAVTPTTTVDLEVDASATVGNTTAAESVTIALQLDSNAVPEDTERAMYVANNNGYGCLSTTWVFTNVSAAAHTVKLLWKTSGNTAFGITYQRGLRVRQRKR